MTFINLVRKWGPLIIKIGWSLVVKKKKKKRTPIRTPTVKQVFVIAFNFLYTYK